MYYDVSDNEDPEFVPRGCESSSSDDGGGPSGNKKARSSTSMRAEQCEGKRGKMNLKETAKYATTRLKRFLAREMSEKRPAMV